MTGRGDEKNKKRKVTKPKKESRTTWDGISRPSTDDYRENWVTIFKDEKV